MTWTFLLSLDPLVSFFPLPMLSWLQIPPSRQFTDPTDRQIGSQHPANW